MPHSSKKSSSSISMKQFRLAREEALRRQFAEVSPDKVAASDEMRLCAEQVLASIPALEHLYLKDGNPVHVLDAILQIGFANPLLGKPICFPPWVSAYVVRFLEEIMGKAVAYPSGDRHAPTETKRSPDGATHQDSDYFRGLTAAQRRDVVLEALGFKGAQGSNPLAQAHRDLNAELRDRQIEVQKSRGLSVPVAARALNDPQLNMSNDPARKVRRDQKRLRGGGT